MNQYNSYPELNGAIGETSKKLNLESLSDNEDCKGNFVHFKYKIFFILN